MKQTGKQEKWVDEAKMEVPYKRITKAERLMEIKSYSLLTEAKGISSGLNDFKNRIKAICEEVYSAFMLENNVKSSAKGNFTWYNFDRSIVHTNIKNLNRSFHHQIKLCHIRYNFQYMCRYSRCSKAVHLFLLTLTPERSHCSACKFPSLP